MVQRLRGGDMSSTETPKRTVLVHLNVEVPAKDQRDADEIASALMEALEIGSNDESFDHLITTVAMAEDV